jgi:hypothetical protein
MKRSGLHKNERTFRRLDYVLNKTEEKDERIVGSFRLMTFVPDDI